MTEQRVPFLRIEAPWMTPRPRSVLSGGRRRLDPAQAGLQSAIASSFDIRPDGPYAFANISIAIPDAGDPPAGGSMKLIVDAVRMAGFVLDDRRQVEAIRLNRYRTESSHPSVNVKVLERSEGDGTFIRAIWPDRQPEPASVVRGGASSYVYLSGDANELSFARGPETPAEYVDALRADWSLLLERGSVEKSAAWATSLSTGWGLHLHVPSTKEFDPDNVLLGVLDLLEVARRDEVGADAGPLTVDELLNEVVVARHDQTGIFAYAYACDPVDGAGILPYFGHMT